MHFPDVEVGHIAEHGCKAPVTQAPTNPEGTPAYSETKLYQASKEFPMPYSMHFARKKFRR